MEDCSIYNECLQVGTIVRNNEIRNYVTNKQDVLSVYCLHVILFDFFFITLMLVHLQKLLNCLIIYLYNTNPSFHRVHEICDQSDLAILTFMQIVDYNWSRDFW